MCMSARVQCDGSSVHTHEHAYVYVWQCVRARAPMWVCVHARVSVHVCARPPQGWGQAACTTTIYLFCVGLQVLGTEYESSTYGQNIPLCGSECLSLAWEMWCPKQRPRSPCSAHWEERSLPESRSVSLWLRSALRWDLVSPTEAQVLCLSRICVILTRVLLLVTACMYVLGSS